MMANFAEPGVEPVTDSLVVVLHFGRAGSLGAHRRVSSLSNVFEATGARCTRIALRGEYPARPGDVLSATATAVVAGRAVPETLSWSVRDVAAELRRLQPSVVICNSVRAYHPSLRDHAERVVLDFVDRLSDSYRDRARILGRRPASLAFRVLAASTRRFEQHPPPGIERIAAGWSDAGDLGATWVPNTLPALGEPVTPPGGPDHDLLFFGSLGYPPNVEAVERLASLWPRLRRARPDLRLLVAGASPAASVRAAAGLPGWTLVEDFDDLATVIGRCRVGVAPLRHASGLQNKVLEAAAHGLPQVVDAVALRGFAPGFPATAVSSDDALVEAITELLDDEEARRAAGEAARRHVTEQYLDVCWTGWARGVLAPRARP